MKVLVLGKEHISGIGKKSGKPFDAILVYITYPKRGVEGQVTETLWLDTADFDADEILCGKYHDLDRDRNSIIDFCVAEG